jgi:hypothetical protein
VRDAAVSGHPRADLGDAVLRDLPHAHAVRGEAGTAVEEDRRDATQRPALAHPLEMLQQALDRQGEGVSRRAVRLGHDGQVPLELADHRDVEVGQLDGLELARRGGDGRAGEGVRAADHLEVHVDLEERERG